MNGLRLVGTWGRRCRAIPAGLAIALFGLTAPYSVASASRLHIPQPTPQPTELMSTLTAPAASGASITVTEGTPVHDTATLSGPNAAAAHGRVTYTIYSDPACTQEIGTRGSSSVRYGAINPSQGAHLPAGTYYWQAAYGGDPSDLPSLSPCEPETVLAFIPWECSQVSGGAHDQAAGERETTTFELSANPSAHQRLLMHWEGGQHVRLLGLKSASCWVEKHRAVFHGSGSASYDGARGFTLRFAIDVKDDGTMRVSATVRDGKETIEHETDAASSDETTVLAGGVPVQLGALF